MSTNIDGINDKIKSEAEKYKKCRKKLLSIANEIVDLLKKLSEVHPYFKLNPFDLKPLTKLFTDLEFKPKSGVGEENILENDNYGALHVEDPAIAFIGMPKVGKTSLMKVLGRIKKSTYTDKGHFTRIFRQDKTSTQLYNENGTFCRTSSMSRLEIGKKSNGRAISNRVMFVGLNSFRYDGLDFIEMPTMNFFNIKTLKSKWIQNDILPIAICVLKNSHTDLATISAKVSQLSLNRNLNILYVVNIFDKDCDPPVMEKDMKTIYQKLQENNVLLQTTSLWHNSSYFHYFSLSKVSDYFHGKRGYKTNYHYNRFCHFEKSIFQFLKSYFATKIEPFYNVILTFQMDVIQKLIEPTEDLSGKVTKNMKEVNELMNFKKNIIEEIQPLTKEGKESLIKRLMTRLQSENEGIINRIKNLDHSYFMQEPDDWVMPDMDSANTFQDILKEVFVQSLFDIVKDFVDEELFETYQNIAGNTSLCSIMDRRFVTKNVGLDRYPSLIETKMKEYYTGPSGYDERLDDRFINIFYDAIKNYLPNLEIPVETDNQWETMSGEWKLQEARKFLLNFNLHLLADDVCSFLIKHVRERRMQIVKKIDNEIRSYQQRILVSEKDRLNIKKMIPDFFPCFLRAFNVKCKYEMEELEKLPAKGPSAGKGIYKFRPVTAIRSDEDIVGKEIILCETGIQKKSEEIYYAVTLQHPRLIKVIGVNMDDDEKIITVYYPLMKTDLGQFIIDYVISQNAMIKFAKQIAEGIKCLHDNGIMHRDLKLSKILLDNDNNIYLSDYGACKNLALSDYSITGNGSHMAPEIVQGRLYTNSVDVYSFAVILWALFNQGRDRQFPDRLTNIPNDIWSLMENCWDANPNKRPTIDSVIVRLNDFRSKSKT